VLKYFKKKFNIIDLLAILPSYIERGLHTGHSVSIIRIFRLVRVFRIFKIGGMHKGVPLFANTIRKALPAVSIMFMFTTLAVVVFSAIVFHLEKGEFIVDEDYPAGAYLRWNILRNGLEETPFKSMLHTCYYAVVTMTTVGYGDFVCTSPGGRLLAVIFMYMGVILLALPISVVGASFQEEYDRLYAPDPSELEDNKFQYTSEGALERKFMVPTQDTKATSIPAPSSGGTELQELKSSIAILIEQQRVIMGQLNELTRRGDGSVSVNLDPTLSPADTIAPSGGSGLNEKKDQLMSVETSLSSAISQQSDHRPHKHHSPSSSTFAYASLNPMHVMGRDED
jgi:hypothetical protein